MNKLLESALGIKSPRKEPARHDAREPAPGAARLREAEAVGAPAHLLLRADFIPLSRPGVPPSHFNAAESPGLGRMMFIIRHSLSKVDSETVALPRRQSSRAPAWT
jgi:hypothetical protein